MKLVMRRDWLRNAILALIFMIALGLIIYATWCVGPTIHPIFSHENAFSQALTIILLALMFLFSLIFFGSLVEYMRQRPGIITIAISGITVGIIAYLLNITWQMWIILAMAFLLILLYVYIAE